MRAATETGAPDADPVIDLRDQQALILGLGRRGGGEGAARYLAQKGARVSVYDAKSADELAVPLARLGDVDLDLTRLGMDEHDLDINGWDLVVRNPAIPNDCDLLNEFRAKGVLIHTEASLFLRDFPGRMIGVTGSKGKTSAAYYLHHLLGGDEAGIVLAGNMGGSCLDKIDGCTASSTAVLELSSFQTETIGERQLSTDIACLTNLQHDHIRDYGDDFRRYWAAKAQLFAFQRSEAWRVHSEGDPRQLLDGAPARWFAVFSDPTDAGGAAWIEDGHIVLRTAGSVDQLVAVEELAVPDEHRQENVVVAVAAAVIAGVPVEDLPARLRTLPVVPHRMEVVPIKSMTEWVNDTAASTPTAAAAGIRSRARHGSLSVICGGSTKHLPIEPLVDAVADVGCSVVLLPGEDSDRLEAAFSAAGVTFAGPVETMGEALDLVPEADTVLLSPGCASFAENGYAGFDDEFHRGGLFVGEVLRRHGIPVSEALLEVLCRPRRGSIEDEIAGDS